MVTGDPPQVWTGKVSVFNEEEFPFTWVVNFMSPLCPSKTIGREILLEGMRLYDESGDGDLAKAAEILGLQNEEEEKEVEVEEQEVVQEEEERETEVISNSTAVPVGTVEEPDPFDSEKAKKYIDMDVLKDFSGKQFKGKVQKFLPKTVVEAEEDFWEIRYEDGDEEDINEEELLKIIDAFAKQEVGGGGGEGGVGKEEVVEDEEEEEEEEEEDVVDNSEEILLVGKHVMKYDSVTGQIYSGKVMGYDPDEQKFECKFRGDKDPSPKTNKLVENLSRGLVNEAMKLSEDSDRDADQARQILNVVEVVLEPELEPEPEQDHEEVEFHSEEMNIIGKKVMKLSDGSILMGTVNGYDEDSNTWSVKWKDHLGFAGEEDLSVDALGEAIKIAEESENDPEIAMQNLSLQDDPKAKKYIGKVIHNIYEDNEGEHITEGSVIKYHSASEGEDKFWTVQYDDGEAQDMDEEELLGMMSPDGFDGMLLFKAFGGDLYKGRVDNFVGNIEGEEGDFWHIVFEDDDSEDVDFYELVDLLEMYDEVNGDLEWAIGLLRDRKLEGGGGGEGKAE
ncbi:hypothetical protein TrLO_g2889 [Triparma laevis f. longispina]|uniref:PTM/DIR17-like Tudor domain-containing protein n=1 Tax=Triparma laevis f. longispina TaxID=1714387 RepID=A0A9W7L0H6_9STRA|nr:hypothetical protein TrLO_g2889 [Triparma laevis f. longispina]